MITDLEIINLFSNHEGKTIFALDSIILLGNCKSLLIEKINLSRVKDYPIFAFECK